MQINPSNIADVKIITLPLHSDERGFFCERFRADIWQQWGMPELVQLNHSRSQPGVLRGLHLQHTPQQGKLVGVTSGRVFDVAVDVRPASPTYLQHVAIELDASKMLWIPPGFLHGFCVVGDEIANMVYFTSSHYNAAGEIGVRYDDAAFGINWPCPAPIVSARDAAAPLWQAIKEAL
jgi:dTDP-4-dehydrorhamnose 3,5-epimerase